LFLALVEKFPVERQRPEPVAHEELRVALSSVVNNKLAVTELRQQRAVGDGSDDRVVDLAMDGARIESWATGLATRRPDVWIRCAGDVRIAECRAHDKQVEFIRVGAGTHVAPYKMET